MSSRSLLFSFLLLVAACLAGRQAPLAAQPVSDSLTFPSVTVTATRLPIDPHRAPARVEILENETIKQSGATTLADLTEARSSIFVKRYGPGGLASFSLRGSRAEQTLVLLDGHRLSNPQVGQLDVTLLPTALLDRIEVLHGPASALYGSDAVGGVVHLRSIPPRDRRLRLNARAGAFGERSVSLLATERIAGIGVSAAFQHDQSTGDYAYVDSTRFNPETGRLGVTSPRKNADVRRNALFLRLNTKTGPHSLTAGFLGTAAERGLFQFGGGREPRQRDRALRIWLEDNIRINESNRLIADGHLQISDLRYQNVSLGVDNTGVTRLANVDIRFENQSHQLGARLHGTLGASIGIGSATHPSLAEDANETRAALFASAVADWDRVVLTPALRFDHVTTKSFHSLNALSPQLGVNVQPTPWKGLRLKGSVGRAFRAPTFNERFWQPGGDPALSPEEGWTGEVGASFRHGAAKTHLEAEATLFTSRLTNQIVWEPQPGGYWGPRNVGQVRTNGWEISATAKRRIGDIEAEAGFLWTHSAARDRTNPESSSWNEPLLYVPDDQVKARASLEYLPIRLDLRARHRDRKSVV